MTIQNVSDFCEILIRLISYLSFALLILVYNAVEFCKDRLQDQILPSVTSLLEQIPESMKSYNTSDLVQDQIALCTDTLESKRLGFKHSLSVPVI